MRLLSQCHSGPFARQKTGLAVLGEKHPQMNPTRDGNLATGMKFAHLGQ